MISYELFSSDLLHLMSQHFEYGYEHACDRFIAHQMSIDPILTKCALNMLFNDRFEDTEVVIGILRIISRMDYSIINPQGVTMAIAGLTHHDTEVIEACIRAFENWKVGASQPILMRIEIKEQWLRDYRDSVIKYISQPNKQCCMYDGMLYFI